MSRCVILDTCYVLSFAIIMLNTSLHNPAVKDKPTVDRFVAMNRGINEGGDLPRELLEVLTAILQYLVFIINSGYGYGSVAHGKGAWPRTKSALFSKFHDLTLGRL